MSALDRFHCIKDKIVDCFASQPFIITITFKSNLLKYQKHYNQGWGCSPICGVRIGKFRFKIIDMYYHTHKKYKKRSDAQFFYASKFSCSYTHLGRKYDDLQTENNGQRACLRSLHPTQLWVCLSECHNYNSRNAQRIFLLFV